MIIMIKNKSVILTALIITMLVLTACGATDNGAIDESDRIENERRSLAIFDDINAQFPADSSGQPVYPDYWGGVYLDDNGRLTILMAETESPEAREFIAGLDKWVQVKTAEYTDQELNDLMNWLNERSDKVGEFAMSWWLDAIGNRVQVDMIRYTDEEIARFRAEVIDSPMISLRDPRADSGGVSNPLQINPELDGFVVMSVTEVAATSVTVSIRNDSNFPLSTGYDHMLEYLDNDKWRFIPSVCAVIYLALPIDPGESFEMTVDLKEYLHLIDPGLFRIRKNVTIDTWQTDELVNGAPVRYPIETLHEVVAEFTWN